MFADSSHSAFLRSRIAAVAPTDPGPEATARARLDDLAKPRGSLGRLEDLAVRICRIRKGRTPLAVDPARQFTLAGDHGLVAEGVTQHPSDITRLMVRNFLAGGAGINALCRVAGIELAVVDAGCRGDPFPDHPALLQRRIGPGTANLARGPAMDEEACAAAVLMGMDLAAKAALDGMQCLGIGEMGIGNTTSASALAAAYLDLSVPAVAGPGAGLGEGGLTRKIAVIERSLDVNREAVQSGDALRILAALGGYEIAGMAGIVLGAAEASLPCLVDGFIAQAAFTAAWKLRPAVADYAVFAHASAEPGGAALLAALGRTPLLDLGLRLGEGTGCALALPLLRAACAIYNDMATLRELIKEPA
jgi:nicotinate-nucleotide--dimethylbenzimidazole phosphoribosyltransferase